MHVAGTQPLSLRRLLLQDAVSPVAPTPCPSGRCNTRRWCCKPASPRCGCLPWLALPAAQLLLQCNAGLLAFSVVYLTASLP